MMPAEGARRQGQGALMQHTLPGLSKARLLLCTSRDRRLQEQVGRQPGAAGPAEAP